MARQKGNFGSGSEINDNVSNSGSETWNVADSFVKLKIFKPLYELDRLEMVAQYGTENVGEFIMPEEIPSRRVDALMRYKDTLKVVFNNTNFIIRKDDRKQYDNLRKHLKFIESVIVGIADVEENQANHTSNLAINENHFRKCLIALQKIKEDLNIPLNNAGIIFRQSDDISFEEMLKDIEESG